jgi:hypothetical protein
MVVVNEITDSHRFFIDHLMKFYWTFLDTCMYLLIHLHIYFFPYVYFLSLILITTSWRFIS